jgi:hypothetical protein
MISATLKKDSPLRAIFPNGIIPLTTPNTHKARLGAAIVPEEVFLLAVRQCTQEQRAALAQRAADLGQGPFEEALAVINSAMEIPVRALHVSHVGMPLRAFL